ncbi:MAG: DUF4129 domain-containing protein [Chloroflexota bacterium]
MSAPAIAHVSAQNVTQDIDDGNNEESSTSQLVSTEVYGQQLEQAAETLSKALGQEDTDGLTIAYEQVAAELSQIKQVEMSNGQTISVTPLLEKGIFAHLDDSASHGELREQIASAASRLIVVAEQLNLSAQDQTAVRIDLLADILSRPEFQNQQSLWERFVEWLSGWIERLLPDSAGNGDRLAWVSQLLLIFVAGIGAVVIAWLLSYWLRQLVLGFAQQSSLIQSRQEEGWPHSASEAKSQAFQQARLGNYRDAVRQLYLSALLTIEEEGIIRPDRSRTNRELLARLGEDGALKNQVAQNQNDQDKQSQGLALKEHMEPIVETFDDVWYGVQEPDQSAFEEYVSEIEQLTRVAQEKKPRP